jgi:6-phosphofructokinase 2
MYLSEIKRRARVSPYSATFPHLGTDMAASRIVTVTPNPAVDMCSSVERVAPFHKLRCGIARRDPGGGGINVARVVRRVGGDATALFPSGGPLGQLLENLVAAEHVKYVALPIAADTREDVTIDERSTGAQFRFVVQGPSLSSAETKSFLELIKANLKDAAYVVASGSLPPGVSEEFYADVSCLASACGVKFVVDSSGAALARALDSATYLVKLSLRELRELTGNDLPEERDWLAAARDLIARRKIEWVALTLGEMGALLVGRNIALRATAPKIVPVSTVGAGDSFLGTLIWALADGREMRAALRLAVASGTAAMLSSGTDLSHPADIAELAGKVSIEDV